MSRNEIGLLLEQAHLPYADITLEPPQHFLTHREGDHLVGVVGLEIYGQAALLRSLAVATGWREKGIGTTLVQQIESLARARGVQQLYLLTTTASRFFKQRGYTEIDRAKTPSSIQATREFQDLCPSSATCLTRALG